MNALFRERWGRWVLFLFGWAALSLLFAPEAYLTFYLRNAPISWGETLQLTVVNSAIALLFIPAIVMLTRRFPLERRRWRVGLLAHIPACLAFSIGHSMLYAVVCHAWNDVGGPLFYRFHPNLLTYWAVVGFTQAFDYFRKYQERERQIAQLQLEVLKSQLQPHFLFNTLHTISAMMHEDVKGADRMISRLSELLRLTLANIGRQEVRLAEELDFVRAYLEIERVRFGERLTAHILVPPPALDALVPALFLQPLVENCVKHGLAPPRENGIIAISAQRLGSRLILTVTDNGCGLPSAAGLREGVGIANSRKRLEQLYPRNNAFRLEARSPSGATVTAEIPFHTALTAAPEAAEVAHEDPNGDRRRRTVGQEAHRDAAWHRS
ncbi:sensor histidine kinase [Povalibacter sp.]|uniref:sensor histidine kinase n=1 Tax=Povalibacter sp. TaxID=1962978 RepID=UPI002F415271